MKSTEKDILLICKGWYNKDEYADTLAALNAYYHREYGNKDITMDKKLAIYLFLRPTYIMFGDIRYLFETTCGEYDFYKPNERIFEEILYERLRAGLTRVMCKNKIALSDYQDMFDKAKRCNYKDVTIGII